MNWIQVLLIGSIIALLVYLLRSRRNARSRAWVKVGYVLFVLAGIYAVLRPDDTTVVAHWFGVRRGTDLMLYALIMAFMLHHAEHLHAVQGPGVALRAAGPGVALEGAQAPGAALAGPCARRKYSTVRRTPSASATFGRQPKTSAAEPMSRQDRLRSPSRGGWNSGSSGAADGGRHRRMQLRGPRFRCRCRR